MPDDPVLSVTDRLVAITQPYQGRVRMTLTYPALTRAHQLLWLVTGPTRRIPSPGSWLGDTTIPASRVEAAASLVMADRAAAPDDPMPPADLRIQPVMSTEGEKQIAAEAAADLVEDDMTVGLGTGSTVAFYCRPSHGVRSTFAVPPRHREPGMPPASWA